MSLRKSDIKTTVLAVLREVQEISGRPYAEIKDDDTPFEALDGFDSLIGIEATAMIEARLGCELDAMSVFVSEDGRRALTLSETCEQVVSLVESKKETAP